MAPVSDRNHSRYGWVRGMPKKFIRGHSAVRERGSAHGAFFKIDGEPCRLIALTQRMYAIVDAADFEELSKHRWYAHKDKHQYTYYAYRHEASPSRQVIAMHRQILGLSGGDVSEGDHKFGNGLDNRRSKLRIAGHADNGRNCKLPVTSTTGLKGVHKKRNKYSANIKVNRKVVHLGTRDTPEAAGELYAMAAVEKFGEFARLR